MIEYGVPITNAVGPRPANADDLAVDPDNNINITVCGPIGADPDRLVGN